MLSPSTRRIVAPAPSARSAPRADAWPMQLLARVSRIVAPPFCWACGGDAQPGPLCAALPRRAALARARTGRCWMAVPVVGAGRLRGAGASAGRRAQVPRRGGASPARSPRRSPPARHPGALAPGNGARARAAASGADATARLQPGRAARRASWRGAPARRPSRASAAAGRPRARSAGAATSGSAHALRFEAAPGPVCPPAPDRRRRPDHRRDRRRLCRGAASGRGRGARRGRLRQDPGR